MNQAAWTRGAALYVPMMAALLVGLWRRPGKRLLAGCLLSVLWAMGSLAVLALLNERAAWWRFAGGGIEFCGTPVELYAGWVVLWGWYPNSCSGGWG